MEENQVVYPRNIQHVSGSFMMNIPSPIARKLRLVKGQCIMVGESDGRIIIKPVDMGVAKRILGYGTIPAKPDGIPASQ